MKPKKLLAFLSVFVVTTFGAPAMANDAKDLIAKFYQTVDQKDLAALDLGAFFADDFKDNNRPAIAPAGPTDKQIALNLFSELKTGFPDAIHSLDILEPIGADRAIVYWTFKGKHSGAFFGANGSGNAVAINGIDIFRVKDGKFVEQWHVEELLSLFEQIKPR